MDNLKQLQDTLPQVGNLEWLGVRPSRNQPLEVMSEVIAIKDQGLEGDHYGGRAGSKRQVTLIQAEHLEAVASIMKRDKIDPGLTRRNLVIRGINLNSIKNRTFLIGDVELEGTGECAPCSRMENNLGAGGWNAMRGHGGITARVVKGGKIKKGDKVLLKITE